MASKWTSLCVKLVRSFGSLLTSNKSQATNEHKTHLKILHFHQTLLLKTSADNSFLQKYRNLKKITPLKMRIQSKNLYMLPEVGFAACKLSRHSPSPPTHQTPSPPTHPSRLFTFLCQLSLSKSHMTSINNPLNENSTITNPKALQTSPKVNGFFPVHVSLALF